MIKGSKFFFDYVHLLHYRCHKINPDCGGSYIDSLDWTKKSNNKYYQQKDNKCFQYAVTVALNHSKIEKHSETIRKTKAFIEKDDWKKLRKIIQPLLLTFCMLNRK